MEASGRVPMVPMNEARPGWDKTDEENKGLLPGVIMSKGKYWKEQRRFLLKNLKDFGFGKASMESLIQDEMAKLCSKLALFPEVILPLLTKFQIKKFYLNICFVNFNLLKQPILSENTFDNLQISDVITKLEIKKHFQDNCK